MIGPIICSICRSCRFKSPSTPYMERNYHYVLNPAVSVCVFKCTITHALRFSTSSHSLTVQHYFKGLNQQIGAGPRAYTFMELKDGASDSGGR